MRRRGFVLAAVLFALVLLAALVSAGFFVALQEVRIGRNAAAEVALRSAAESGIARSLATWDPRTTGSLRPGGVVVLPGAAPPSLAALVEVRRLNDLQLVLRSSASDGGGASQIVEALARLVGPEFRSAAVRARLVDPPVVARADGVDRPPPGWVCPLVTDTAPGVIVEAGASDSAFFRFGRMDWNALAGWARSVPSGGDSLAVHYVDGDTTLTAGRFTGVLVVAGNLVLRGGAEIAGLALVRGVTTFDQGGGAVYGSVVSSQVLVNQSVTPSQLVLGYSSCSARSAALSRAVPMAMDGVPVWGVF